MYLALFLLKMHWYPKLVLVKKLITPLTYSVLCERGERIEQRKHLETQPIQGIKLLFFRLVLLLEEVPLLWNEHSVSLLA